VSQKQMLALAAVVIALIVAIFYFTSQRPTDSGISSSSSSAPALTKKWEFTGSGIFYGALALAEDGTIYAASDDGYIYAIDPSGSLQWKNFIGPTRSSPSVGPDGAIYVANGNGKLIAFNHSGVIRWSTQVYDGLTAGQNGAAMGRDDIYIHARNGVYAVRLSNGNVDWKSFWGGDQWGSVTLLSDGTLLSPGRGRLNTIDTYGDLGWQYPPLAPEMTQRNGGFPPPGNFFVTSGVAIGSSRTLYTAHDRFGMAAIGLDGTLKWELPARAMQMNSASPVVSSDGTIYFAGANTVLTAVDSFGTPKWTLSFPTALLATPVLAQDGSLFLLDGNYLYVITREGKIIAKTLVGFSSLSSPTLAPDGTFYVATSDGKVIAYDGVHGPLMDSPWPKYQGDVANSGNPRTN
jgi:outer membrane protein assembly factor BamB